MYQTILFWYTLLVLVTLEPESIFSHFIAITPESSNDFDQKQKSYIMPILMLITCWLCIPMNLKIGYASASVRSSIGVLADSVADKFPLLVVTITLACGID